MDIKFLVQNFWRYRHHIRSWKKRKKRSEESFRSEKSSLQEPFLRLLNESNIRSDNSSSWFSKKRDHFGHIMKDIFRKCILFSKPSPKRFLGPNRPKPLSISGLYFCWSLRFGNRTTYQYFNWRRNTDSYKRIRRYRELCFSIRFILKYLRNITRNPKSKNF